MSKTIHPVVLCGGSGTRLWPLSRAQFPKQFGHVTGTTSLFQQCIERLRGDGFAAPMIVTGAAFRFIVRDQLSEIGTAAAAILIEPEPRNTAAAVLAAAIAVSETDPEGLLLISPSDHFIPDAEAFRKAVALGVEAAEAGGLVTFGIAPDRPETGYGYLEVGEAASLAGADAPIPLVRFVEKPDAVTAERMMASARHVWNAGIFLAKAGSIIDAFERHAPDLLGPVDAAVRGARDDLGFTRLASDPWNAARSVSIDYAVMEQAQNLSVVLYRGSWSDLGDWEAVWRETPKSGNGVACSANAVAIGCRNALLRSGETGPALVGIGLEDMIVVSLPDAVLVAPRSRAQDVRDAVTLLKEKGVAQATEFTRDRRPWGWFETVDRGDRHQVKRIVVKPGAVLSLQSHVHRAEHWIVVSGTAKVTIGEAVRLLSENESIYVPLGAIHRLENPGKVDLHVIEVQTGAYLGEDDIIRYEDVYARSAAE